ncbi:MAG: nitroreductase family protein [Anaerosomatales bacterium]|nr:nitroreductase family protein [Anaerosomatales bacterium]
MELLEAIAKRRSIRLYTGEQIDRDVIDDLIDAAIHAPSSFNAQPWHFHVATGHAREAVGEAVAQSTRFLEEYASVLPPELLDKAARFYADLGKAPVVIGVSVPQSADEVDQVNTLVAAGAAIENLMLRAVDLGLGACCITAPRWVVDQVKAALGVPAERLLAGLVLVGKPAEEPVPAERRRDVATYLE